MKQYPPNTSRARSFHHCCFLFDVENKNQSRIVTIRLEETDDLGLKGHRKMFALRRLVSVLNLIVAVMPFSDIRFISNRISNRSSKTTHEVENSLQSDEDLFVDLFLESKKRSSGDNPQEERNTDNGTETARPIVRNKIPPSYNIDEGAGVPRPSLQPDEIVSLLMTALENVDVPFATCVKGNDALFAYLTRISLP